MSRENVGIARRATDAHNERDWDSVAGLITANIEWFPSMAGTLEGGSYRGREGMERYFEQYDETRETFMVENEDYRGVEDRVIAAGRLTASGRGSGVPVSTPVWTVFEFQAGKASRGHVYLDAGEASRAAGAAE